MQSNTKPKLLSENADVNYTAYDCLAQGETW